MELLQFLFQNDLAWRPQNPHGVGYIEMHPRLAEAILATLACACAKNEGLCLVTEFPQIYGRTIHRTKVEIFQSCLGTAPKSGQTPQIESEQADLVEYVVHHWCDVSKLTPETLLALNKDWEAIGAFKDSLEKLAADIPPKIENPRILDQYLRERADRMFARWREDNKNLSRRLKDLFSGDDDEAAKTVGKLVEKGLGESIGAASGGLFGAAFGGNITYHTLLGAGAGLALAVVVRTAKNVAALKQKRGEYPLRYLTMMEKAGVSYVVSI